MRQGNPPPVKYMRASEMCDWKHISTFTADMSEHDPENCCLCKPELAGKGEHVVKYFETWSF